MAEDRELATTLAKLLCIDTTHFGDGGDDNEVPVPVIEVALEDCRRRERRGRTEALAACVFALVGDISGAGGGGAAEDKAAPIRGNRILRPEEEVDGSILELEA